MVFTYSHKNNQQLAASLHLGCEKMERELENEEEMERKCRENEEMERDSLSLIFQKRRGTLNQGGSLKSSLYCQPFTLGLNAKGRRLYQ